MGYAQDAMVELHGDRMIDNTSPTLEAHRASTECLHELNPAGGFGRQHKRLCGYHPECFEDAVVHVRVVDRGWCGNVCGKCRDRISREHRVAVSENLRGLNNYDSET